MQEGQVLRVKFDSGVSLEKRFTKIVRILTDMIEDGMRDQVVREKAKQILAAANVQGHDELGEIRAITEWVQTHMVYRKEPLGVEIFHTGRRLIKDIESGNSAGDCDDFVILWGSLLGSIGYPVGALIVDSNGDGVYNHVMGVTKTFSPNKEFGDNWIPVELIYPEFKLGQSVPISQVYPLMADAKTIRAEVGTESLNGVATYHRRPNYATKIQGILGEHPFIGAMKSTNYPSKQKQLAGFGAIPKNKSAYNILQSPQFKQMGDISWTTNETWGILLSGAAVGITAVTLFNRYYK